MNESQKEFLTNRSTDYTILELSEHTGLTEQQCQNFCHRNNLRYKFIQVYRKHRKNNVEIKTKVYPPAVYSNKSPYGIAS